MQITQNIFPPRPNAEAALSQTLTQRFQKFLANNRSPLQQANDLAQIRQNRRMHQRVIRQRYACQFQRTSFIWRKIGQPMIALLVFSRSGESLARNFASWCFLRA